MIVSPLQLESYFVAESHIVAQVEFEAPETPEELATRVQNALHVGVKLFDSQDDSSRRAIELSVSLREESQINLPYAVTLAVVGFFRLAPEYRPDDSAHHADLWNINAPSVLYGVAREILSSFTCRGPYPSICLPSVTFADLPTTEEDVTSKVESDSASPEKVLEKSTANKARIVSARKKKTS